MKKIIACAVFTAFAVSSFATLSATENTSCCAGEKAAGTTAVTTFIGTGAGLITGPILALAGILAMVTYLNAVKELNQNNEGTPITIPVIKATFIAPFIFEVAANKTLLQQIAAFFAKESLEKNYTLIKKSMIAVLKLMFTDKEFFLKVVLPVVLGTTAATTALGFTGGVFLGLLISYKDLWTIFTCIFKKKSVEEITNVKNKIFFNKEEEKNNKNSQQQQQKQPYVEKKTNENINNQPKPEETFDVDWKLLEEKDKQPPISKAQQKDEEEFRQVQKAFNELEKEEEEEKEEERIKQDCKKISNKILNLQERKKQDTLAKIYKNYDSLDQLQNAGGIVDIKKINKNTLNEKPQKANNFQEKALEKLEDSDQKKVLEIKSKQQPLSEAEKAFNEKGVVYIKKPIYNDMFIQRDHNLPYNPSLDLYDKITKDVPVKQKQTLNYKEEEEVPAIDTKGYLLNDNVFIPNIPENRYFIELLTQEQLRRNQK